MTHRFAEKTLPEIEQAIRDEAVLLLPLGQTEQHGPHLPTGCDSIIAEQVCDTVAATLDGDPPVLVMPPIHYGYEPKSVQQWPAFRIRWEIMVSYIADVCTSAVEMGFEKLIIISTHGPHSDVAKLAAREVFDRTGKGIVFSMPHGIGAKHFTEIRKSEMGGTSHAGEYETALLMHFGYEVDTSKLDDRDRVKECNEWVAGDMLSGSGKASWSTWALQISETGVYGDPSKASAETGRSSFENIVTEYCGLVRYVHRKRMPQQDFPVYPRSW